MAKKSKSSRKKKGSGDSDDEQLDELSEDHTIADSFTTFADNNNNNNNNNDNNNVSFGGIPDDREEADRSYQFLDQLTAGVIVFFLGVLLCLIFFFDTN